MSTECFHCGLPVLAAGHRAFLLGGERDLCCAGCEAVARTIAGAGLESYYRTRTRPAAPAVAGASLPALPPLPEAQTEASLILDRVRCAACLWLIEQTLRRIPGVSEAAVNYATQRAHVRWDGARTRLEAIVAALRAVGYDAAPYDPRRREERERKEARASLWRLFVAGFGAMQVMMYAFPAYVDGDAATLSADTAQLMRWASLLLTLPVMLFSCGPFFAGARQELAARRVGLETPIAAGIAAAFVASAWATVTATGEVYFDSISMLVFLILGARHVQASVRRRAARGLDPLYRVAAAPRLAPGETCGVAPGERFPADGIVRAGVSSVDESLFTGEARPVPKCAGDEVLAGSINLDQPLTVEVTRAGADTRAALVARLVERAAALRPASVEAAERVAAPLTCVVLALAAAALLWSGSVWSAVAVLVIACPCALALGTPVVLTRANARLQARGVLVTRSRVFEPLRKATDILFDKTGTLTEGKLRLAGVAVAGGESREHCLALAAALEASSRHPIAQVFAARGLAPAAEPRYAAGRGIEGCIAGRRFRLGSREFCAEIGALPDPFGGPEARHTRVYLAGEQRWLAAFDLEDRLRPEAAEVVRRLRARGMRVHLISGDRAAAAADVARRADIDLVRGGMLPQDKYAYLRELQAQGRIAVVVGDGVNDGPVLAAADASFAMGSGADSAQLQADAVLQAGGLGRVIETLDVADRAMRLVRQGIGWALAYNVLALPLAAAGLVGPLHAALGMGASSLAVVLNAMRPLAARKSWKASTSSSRSPSPSYS